MYPNYKNMSETSDQCFSGTSGTPRAASNPGLLEPSISSSEQPQHKYPGAGPAQFVPSLNTITSSQDLQWLVQPSLLPPPVTPRVLRPPLPPSSGPLSPPQHASQMPLLRPGVIRAAGGTGLPVPRRRNDDFLSQEELERRRIRRERNKMAAAKCRNRRRELTDSLQNETDQLENDKAGLQKEIAELEKEKEKLELVLEAHRPICKIQDSDSDSDPDSQLASLGAIKIEAEDPDLPGPSVRQDKPKPKIILPPTMPVSSSSSTSALPAESDALHTPVLISTPSPSTSANLVFTYPSASLDASTAAAASHHLGLLASSSSSLHSQMPHPCSIAHRRSSSSGDQSSDHSLNSPTILTL